MSQKLIATGSFAAMPALGVQSFARILPLRHGQAEVYARAWCLALQHSARQDRVTVGARAADQ